MFDQSDFLMLTVLLLVVIVALMIPPGPGTPLKSKAQQPRAGGV